MCPKAQTGEGRADLLNHEWCTSKAQINGTTAHITAIFGFTLAGLIIQDLYGAPASRRQRSTDAVTPVRSDNAGETPALQ
jgi:tRNA A37 threonylcarbamoyladenosine dehydratase